MGDKNRSRNNCSVEDVDSKLKQYMLINKQISKTLTVQRCEIANLKNTLRASTSEIINLRMECHKWKNKFVEIRKMYISHIELITTELQTNADKINSLSDDCTVVGAANGTLVEILVSPTNASRSVDSARRVSKTFETAKNRSDKEEYIDMDTIEEENEDSHSIESTSESKADRDFDTSNVEDIDRKDDNSIENRDESKATEDSVENGDESRDSTEESVENGNESKESSDESLENGNESKESSDESFENGNESKESIEEPSDSEKENYESAEESDQEKDRETDESYQENNNSDDETNIDDGGVENECTSKVDLDDTSYTENKTESVQQISSYTTDSTIRNDDSDKENDNLNSTMSISNRGRSVFRVVTNQPIDKLTSTKNCRQIKKT